MRSEEPEHLETDKTLWHSLMSIFMKDIDSQLRGMMYLCQLLEPYVSNATHQNRALTVPQTVCIALRYFATGTFMYQVGDAENLSKNMVCRAIREVVLALKANLITFL